VELPGPQFALLGPLRVSRNGSELRLAGRHARALLAYLALQPDRLVTQDRLVEALWTRPPPTAAKIVQITVSRLRKVLGEGVIVSEQRGYRLAAGPEDVDIERFELGLSRARSARSAGRVAEAAHVLDEALALWRGDALADLDDEPFVCAERARLEELRLVALEDRADAMLALGRHAELVPELEALAREQPLRERVREQLMLALYRDGRQADALRVYGETRALLVEQAGVDPGPALRRLQRLILVQDRTLELDDPPHGENGLPADTFELIGRDAEVDAVVRLLTSGGTRLVTLTGPGGIGKTRLALEVARRLERHQPDGVVFVPLDTLSDPSLVAATILRALGSTPSPQDDAAAALSHRLETGPPVLLLDNFEHLLAAAPVVSRLLASVAALRVIVTSREALRIGGEHEWRVPPLSVPGRTELDAEALLRNAAVRLFLARAGAARTELERSKDSIRAIGELCRRLEGLPLSIELAAARARLLDPATLVTRIASRLDLPGVGARDAPPRQRTLRATLDWSFELLDPFERALLARLGVFAGDFPFEAAAFVCEEPEPAMLRGLESLVDKSLVAAGIGPDHRFGMLEALREYALERLAAGGDELEVRRRHALWYRDLAERAEAKLGSPEQGAWLDLLEREHPNLRAAVVFALEQRDGETALRLGAALRRYLDLRGHAAEGRAWLESALELAEDADPLLRLRALGAAGVLAGEEGDWHSARSFFEQSVALARSVGAQDRLARELANLAHVAVFQGDRDSARGFYEQAAFLQRRLGDHRNLALTLENLGSLALLEGDVAGAMELQEEAHAVGRLTGEPQVLAAILTSLARASIAAGSTDAARARLRESLALVTEVGWVQGTAECLELFALVDAREQRGAARTAVLLGAADALRMGVGAGRPKFDWPAYEEATELVRSRLGKVRYEANWERGRRLPLSDVVALCSDANQSGARLSTSFESL
jgi:predicted ATPase/DNA-binding SARP family transcriptional activator